MREPRSQIASLPLKSAISARQPWLRRMAGSRKLLARLAVLLMLNGAVAHHALRAAEAGVLRGSDGVEAAFAVADGACRWAGYRDLAGGSDWHIGGPRFSVETVAGQRTNLGEVGFAHQVATDQQIELQTALADPAIEVRQVYSFCLDGRTLRIQTFLRARGEPVLVRRVGLLELQITGQNFRLMGPEFVSSPVFGDRVFAGIEHPSARCTAQGDSFALGQAIHARLGRAWTELPGAVFGSATDKDRATAGSEALRHAFLRYLDTVRVKPKDMHVHYNDWWTAPVPSSAQFVLGNIAALKASLYDPTGFFFDSYALDAGWSDPKSLWEIDPKQFPERFAPIAEGLMGVFDALRALNPDIALEPTCFGYQPSPWWLMHVPFIIGPFGDDSPYGRCPAPDYLESMTTAREIKNLEGRGSFLMPSSALQCFDLIVQCPGAFQNHAVMAIGRGRWFISSYINPKFMDAEAWRFFADAMRWARHHRAFLQEPLPFGGHPERREAYGYAFLGETRQVFCLRNPWMEETSLALPAMVRTTNRVEVRMLYPRPTLIGHLAPQTESPKLPLGPYETQLIELVPTDRPTVEPVARPSPKVAWAAKAEPRIEVSGPALHCPAGVFLRGDVTAPTPSEPLVVDGPAFPAYRANRVPWSRLLVPISARKADSANTRTAMRRIVRIDGIYLDALDWTEASTGWGQAQRNRSIMEKPMTLSGRPFVRGIGAHAVSRIVYSVPEGFATFAATIGKDQEVSGGSVVFVVEADGKEVFRSAVFRNETPVQEISVPIVGVKRLALIVADAGDNIMADHADWAEARLLR
ncbi:MAG TPA: NPCBM/NEW2 domain-containing protein [Verrucomicrobiota bacterium]|nr:NPCBM/NEW2 domain-containing protein [Verrucomicrobiota bacterium]HNU50901.1 NPCBM/NEW2 domain-containing protein [Verrucomicrobiota bacterium]